MVFNSWVYMLFLPLVFLLYWPLPHRGRLFLLLVANAVFYGWWDVRFLVLIGLTISIDFIAGGRIGRLGPDDPARKRWLLVSVIGNLGILGTFKYFDFFSASAADLLMELGITVDPFLLKVALPVGISFYTFQSMAYTIDVFRDRVKPVYDPLVYATYVSFFPQLVAGPIERAGHLIPQIEHRRTWGDADPKLAFYLILWGLYKKIVIADNLAKIVALCLDGEATTAGCVVVGSLAFAFQIYCDFSAYTDIARGSALLLGVRLCENFKLPYFAISPSDFWTRWHISLSSWLRDYLYISLGGNRNGRRKTYRNLFLTMLLGGLWHGAAWNFVIWGIYHGLLLIGYRIVFGRAGRPACKTVISKAGWMLVMFIFTLGGWAIFRATAPGQLLEFAQALWRFDWHIPSGSLRDVLFLASGVLVMMIVQARSGDMMVAFRSSILIRIPLAILLIGSIVMLGATGGVEFIYFQF